MAENNYENDYFGPELLFGWLRELFGKLETIVREQRIPLEAFERLTTDRGSDTLAKVMQMILTDWQAELPNPVERLQGDQLLPNHYRIRVTYAPPLSMDVLKQKWGSDNVSFIFDGRLFTLHASCIDMDRTAGERTFYVHDVGSSWESEEQIEWGAKQCNPAAPNGYRPATEQETYEFAEAHPELEDFIGLGSSALYDGLRFVTFVWQSGSRRLLDHTWVGGKFLAGRRVLFVSK